MAFSLWNIDRERDAIIPDKARYQVTGDQMMENGRYFQMFPGQMSRWFSHRSDGDGDARLIHGADALVVWRFDDGHLLLLLREASDGHCAAADGGLTSHH